MPRAGTKGERKRYIVVPNWDEYQHKDVWKKSGGSPPWIKNYTRLLSKDEYLDLSLSQRGLLHGIWLLYASSGERLSTHHARTLLCTNKGESRHFLDNLERLSDAGFVHIQSHLEESREEEIRKTTSRGPVDNPVEEPQDGPQAPRDLLAYMHEKAHRGG